MKRLFAISVLAVISKPKKEKQESTRSIVCISLLGPLRNKNYFHLKVPVSRPKRERELVALLGPLRKLRLAVTPRPLGLSASNFVGL